MTGADVRPEVESRDLMLSLISGAHDRDGLVAMRGPGIVPGVRIQGANLVDIAPTALYLLGQPIPAEMDGKVLRGAIAQQILVKHAIRMVSEEEGPSRTDAGYSKEEERIVGERLRGLGYVD